MHTWDKDAKEGLVVSFETTKGQTSSEKGPIVPKMFSRANLCAVLNVKCYLRQAPATSDVEQHPFQGSVIKVGQLSATPRTALLDALISGLKGYTRGMPHLGVWGSQLQLAV